MLCAGWQREVLGNTKRLLYLKEGQFSPDNLRIHTGFSLRGAHALGHGSMEYKFLWGDGKELINFIALFSNGLQSSCAFLWECHCDGSGRDDSILDGSA